MSNKQKKISSHNRGGLDEVERAFHRLDMLDSVIAAIEKGRSEYIEAVKSETRNLHDTFGGCHIALFGYEASFLLRCLKAAREHKSDPFGIEATARKNRGRSIPEKVDLARQVQAEISSGKNREQALLAVGARYNMNGSGGVEVSSVLAKIYDKWKGYA